MDSVKNTYDSIDGFGISLSDKALAYQSVGPGSIPTCTNEFHFCNLGFLQFYWQLSSGRILTIFQANWKCRRFHYKIIAEHKMSIESTGICCVNDWTVGWGFLLKKNTCIGQALVAAVAQIFAESLALV